MSDLGYSRNKIMAKMNLHSDSGYVQFGFFNGSALKNPKGLLEGKGRYVRHIKIHDPSGIDRRAFAALLEEAAGSR